MPLSDLPDLYPFICIALLLGWSLTAALLLRRQSALRDELAQSQQQQALLREQLQEVQLELHQQEYKTAHLYYILLNFFHFF